MADADPRQHNYTPAVTSTANGGFGLGSNLTWDAYQREVYNKLNEALQKQANFLLQRRGVTEMEARALVEQRNTVLRESRSKLSPFGELYSELKKPSNKLPDYDALLARKGTVAAVVESVGKTNAVVNKISVVMKYGGRGLVVLQVVVSVVVIAQAPEKQRGRVAAGEVGGAAVGGLTGWAGAWAGCTTGAALASPTLAVPVAGEAADAGACLVGGLIGGFGLGMLGGAAGHKAGEAVYDMVTRLRWLN